MYNIYHDGDMDAGDDSDGHDEEEVAFLYVVRLYRWTTIGTKNE